jgi:dihydroorotate dehydrogenase
VLVCTVLVRNGRDGYNAAVMPDPYSLIRSLLFALDAERSHDVALAALRGYGVLPGSPQPLPGRSRQLFGLTFRNAVGLAAGLDKEAHAVLGLARLGFGHVEVGTVTPLPQPGNPKPRLFRLPSARAIINRMGFNSGGVTALAARLTALREGGRLGSTILGVNVGKNKDTPLERAAADYVACMTAVYGAADYLTLNLSSPNTPGLRTLQSADALGPLLGEIREAGARLAERHGRRVPVLLKIAPDLLAEDLEIIAAAALEHAIDGLIATNTTIARPGLGDEPLARQAGGLSGAPLRPMALSTVAALRSLLDPRIPIVGVGGIQSRADGAAMLAAGADLLQIYTGFIYRGPALVRELADL